MNLFAYCNNNPVNYLDPSGTDPLAVQYWTASMWWLCLVDAVLPIGDIIYGAGILILTMIAIDAAADSLEPEISWESDENPPPLSPNNNNGNDDDDDDDDKYDDYYDDDRYWGGREKIGKGKGNTPGNNQKQNKQFNDATRNLNPEQRRMVHDEITKKGLGFHDIKEIAKSITNFIVLLF